MSYQAHFDGSGTHPSSRAVTLACVAGSDHACSALSGQWSATLQRHGVEELHMYELGEGKQKLCGDLLTLISTFRPELVAGSCTVVRDAHSQALLAEPVKAAEAMCVDFCFTALQSALNEPMDLYFDQNEPFLKHIDKVWRVARKKAPEGTWPRQISRIQKSDPETSIPMQAADLVAWAVNRLITRADNHWLATDTLLALPHFHRFYDSAAKILSVYDADGVKANAPSFPGL